MDRRFRIARVWSNRELRRLAPLFKGDIVNVSAWDDRDKEGGYYKDYFTQKNQYYLTNYSGDRGLQGKENEYFLDLTQELPSELEKRFDVVFNHTTLEHVFEVRKAFQNLCLASRDIVIVVVPFCQKQHGKDMYNDFWRFTPTCLRYLFQENGLEVIYEAQNQDENAAIYLLFVGSQHPEKWRQLMPPYKELKECGDWIGRPLYPPGFQLLKNTLTRFKKALVNTKN
ncbi:hypothetical protein [Chroococcidiopsis sp. CCMEE 29]|uniref:hypothetical protein n=1 Tax=Chroococcidiopsis sp. CCMEE 29 TaxID=155894 RepID=UPI0020221450|nr:hypothetical protein [Chroococcidiopsis sp. CCMEE 29]